MKSRSVDVDKNGFLLAIEMLIPYERRKLLFNIGNITHDTVKKLAEDCEVPVDIAQMALDEKYHRWISVLREKAKIGDLF